MRCQGNHDHRGELLLLLSVWNLLMSAVQCALYDVAASCWGAGSAVLSSLAESNGPSFVDSPAVMKSYLKILREG